MIDIQQLTFRYSRQAVPAIADLSVRVREGSLFGLLGPNGSGKTTLISILAGLLPVQGGRVTIGGDELRGNVSRIQRFSSLVPQEDVFYPSLTVVENLAFFAGVLGIEGAERQARMREVLGTTGLERARAMRAGRLSGGMKRRLSIAVGLLNRPKVLFLDEPTAGIDPQSRHFILEFVRRVNAAGTTVIYTSHYMEEVESLCDDIGILDEGRLLVQGSLAELLAGAAAANLDALFLGLTKTALRD